MSLDLHIHAEVNVGIFLPRGYRRVLHWVQIHTVQICRQTNRRHINQLQLSASADYRRGDTSLASFTLDLLLLIRCYERHICTGLGHLHPDTSDILKRMGVFTFDTNCHVGIDALPGILQANFFNLNCE